MSYAVKTIYTTLQGEGAHTGRPAVFLRFTGCNLWTGREQDRTRAICQFCDTDFLGTDGENGRYYGCAKELAAVVRELWEASNAATDDNAPYVVCTGGEPLLQLNARLIDALHDAEFEVAVETNGTRRAPEGIDWVCVSPKAGTELILTSGHELKLVFPQSDAPPEAYESLDFDHFFLQPMDGPDVEENTRLAEEFIRVHPRWRLSRQMHKVWGMR